MVSVAPHAGAWIETEFDEQRSYVSLVAPHAGAWIETHLSLFAYGRNLESHPMRVRGLKPRRNQHTALGYASHPMRVRWLKCKLLYSVGKSVLALHSRWATKQRRMELSSIRRCCCACRPFRKEGRRSCCCCQVV